VSGQLVAQLREVVELAVEDRDDVAGLVRHRLEAQLRVDDAQALVTQHAYAELLRAALVRPAMRDARAHVVDERRLRGARR
jgi:hypothetical protein